MSKAKVDSKMFELSRSTSGVATSPDRGAGARSWAEAGSRAGWAFGIVPVGWPAENPGRMAAGATFTDSRCRKGGSESEVTGCPQHGWRNVPRHGQLEHCGTGGSKEEPASHPEKESQAERAESWGPRGRKG